MELESSLKLVYEFPYEIVPNLVIECIPKDMRDSLICKLFHIPRIETEFSSRGEKNILLRQETFCDRCNPR